MTEEQYNVSMASETEMLKNELKELKKEFLYFFKINEKKYKQNPLVTPTIS